LDGRPEVELGYRLCLQHWGKGYAVEAAEATLQCAFTELRRDMVWAFVLPQNRPSLKVLEKLRFKYRRDILHVEQWHRLYAIGRGRHSQDDPGAPL
jgi:RimJ/RimL family protein N-acetyltransferase